MVNAAATCAAGWWERARAGGEGRARESVCARERSDGGGRARERSRATVPLWPRAPTLGERR